MYRNERGRPQLGVCEDLAADVETNDLLFVAGLHAISGVQRAVNDGLKKNSNVVKSRTGFIFNHSDFPRRASRHHGRASPDQAQGTAVATEEQNNLSTTRHPISLKTEPFKPAHLSMLPPRVRSDADVRYAHVHRLRDVLEPRDAVGEGEVVVLQSQVSRMAAQAVFNPVCAKLRRREKHEAGRIPETKTCAIIYPYSSSRTTTRKKRVEDTRVFEKIPFRIANS